MVPSVASLQKRTDHTVNITKATTTTTTNATSKQTKALAPPQGENKQAGSPSLACLSPLLLVTTVQRPCLQRRKHQEDLA